MVVTDCTNFLFRIDNKVIAIIRIFWHHVDVIFNFAPPTSKTTLKLNLIIVIVEQQIFYEDYAL